ncbi:MAG: ATP-binding cassette domain-containing protein, partial [Gammaproteobacteria bacterium]
MIAQTESLISARDLGVKFDDRWVLKHISLDIRPKEIVTLIGPNGCGKTTLVKTLLGLIKPTAGLITKAPDLKIGYMPQRFAIEPTLPMTVERFLKLSQTYFEGQ